MIIKPQQRWQLTLEWHSHYSELLSVVGAAMLSEGWVLEVTQTSNVNVKIRGEEGDSKSETGKCRLEDSTFK